MYRMKVVKDKYSRKRERDSGEQMRQAIMELVREAQGDRKQETDNSFLGRSVRFVGSAAGWIHGIFSSAWVLIPLAIALLYLLMRWTGLSLEIHRAGELLFRIA
ncbi:MAG: hypothetical protein WAW07_16520 [Bacteroidales bacterium]